MQHERMGLLPLRNPCLAGIAHLLVQRVKISKPSMDLYDGDVTIERKHGK